MSSVGNKTIVALLVAAGLSACAGNGNGLDSNGNPVTPGSGDSGVLTADFQSIQENVFDARCVKCHSGAGAPEGLQLDAGHSYDLLVGHASAEQSNVLRVEPGDPDSSYIIRKLEGASGISGVRMPADGPPYLPQATIDVIRQWITNGAPKPAAAASVEAAVKAVQHFSVNETSPDNGSIVSMAVQHIVVGFNGDIDSNLLNNTTVTLSRALAHTLAPVEPPVPVSITVPVGNPGAIMITPQTPLPNGDYVVTLRGTLASMNALPLGSDYSFTFTVDALQ
jgi:methionine-rich copper-binding protein CopC